MVPSSGSTIQRGLSGLPSISPPSSSSMPQSGRALRNSSTIVCFGALVGHRHEVGRPLAADLELLDLAEVAPQARRRLARGALHDGDQAGVGDHRLVRAADIVRGCRRRRRSACPRRCAAGPSPGRHCRAWPACSSSRRSGPSPPRRPRRSSLRSCRAAEPRSAARCRAPSPRPCRPGGTPRRRRAGPRAALICS